MDTTEQSAGTRYCSTEVEPGTISSTTKLDVSKVRDDLTPSRQDADVLDRLLCGEHRALETYREWIERFGHDAAIEQIAEGHRKAAASLQQLLSGSDGMLTGNSSPWAIWERAQRSGKNTFDKAASFRAIREGEESAIENYVEALRDRRLDPACRNLIHDRLLPQAHQGLVLLVTA